MGRSRRIALVTGAATRVGRQVALRLAADGFSIAAHYHASSDAARSLAAEIEREGGRARLYPFDLSKERAAGELARRVLEEHGAIDLLVNNASLWTRTPIEELTPETFDTLLAINLRSPFLLALRIGQAMKRQGEGLIVNILDWSIERPHADYLPYGIAKAGLAAATRGLARALAPAVRVNAVAPGPVLLRDGLEPDRVEKIRRAIPLGRIGEPSDVAEAVAYLVRSPFTTGTILTVDGGRSLT